MNAIARHPDRRAVARRGRRARWVAAGAALAVLLAGCGGAADEDTSEAALPVVEAEAVPFEDAGLAPPSPPVPSEPAEPTASGEPTDADADAAEGTSPDPATSATTIGPSNADAAAFVGSDVLADLRGLEHVVVDRDGDTWAEVVATGIRDRRGVVRVAWWTADGYEVLAEVMGGAGRDVTDLRAADVNDNGITELLVAVEGEGLASLSVWSVPRRGVVEPLEAVGGCHDGSHVYGVTRVRLVDQGEAPPAIVADCDDSPLPVADWSEQRWVWEQGAYRFVEAQSPPPDDDRDDDDEDGDGDGDDGNGNGNGNGNGHGNGNGDGAGNGNGNGDEDDDDDDDDGDDD